MPDGGLQQQQLSFNFRIKTNKKLVINVSKKRKATLYPIIVESYEPVGQNLSGLQF